MSYKAFGKYPKFMEIAAIFAMDLGMRHTSAAFFTFMSKADEITDSVMADKLQAWNDWLTSLSHDDFMSVVSSDYNKEIHDLIAKAPWGEELDKLLDCFVDIDVHSATDCGKETE